MGWSLRIARIDGTDIKVHWSFVLVIPYFLNLTRPSSLGGVLLSLGVLLLLFVCIALHELGHSVVAGRLGIPTRSIVLWPLGGFAVLSRAPERPLHQLAIYGAGPLVNLLLAGVLFLAARAMPDALVAARRSWPASLPTLLYAGVVLRIMANANLGLALFNLIPAFPLDGGRIVRALLTLLLGERRADPLVLGLSWLLVVGLIVYGVINGDWLLLLIAAMVFAGAGLLSKNITARLNQSFGYLSDRGAVYAQRGDSDAAIAYYNRTIPAKPGRALSYNNRGYAYSLKQQYDRAIADYDQAIQIAPTLTLAHVNRAEAHFACGDRARALADWRQLVQLRPDDATAHQTLGYGYMRLYDFDRALAAYEQAARLAPDSAVAYAGSGFCYLERNVGRADDPAHALAAFERAIQLAPGGWIGYHGRALLACLAGDYRRALADYERAPTVAMRFIGRGHVYCALGDAERAGRDYDRAAELQPNDGTAYLHRGMLRYSQGEHARAANDWERAIACSPVAMLSHSELWLLLYAGGNLAWAVAYYGHAACLRPDDPLVYRGRADAYCVNGEHALAVADYSRAINLAPEQAEAYLGRGIAQRGLGAAALARADLERALELSDNA
ncbi:MAG: tetratricopeptide repeat protein, partial [Roseiflexaceae bacterium]